MGDRIVTTIDAKLQPSAFRDFRAIISDAFAFVRSAEANQALATVTFDQLIGDQIKRNGESKDSNASQFDPYSHDTAEAGPAGTAPKERANFLGAADGNAPTKLDRVLAIKNALSDVITEIKQAEPVDVADASEYQDRAEASVPLQEEEG